MFSSENFSSRLKELKDLRNISTRELALKLDVSTQTVGHWQTGYRTPPIEKIYAIADFFNVSLDYLVGRSEFVSSPISTDFQVHDTLQLGHCQEISEYNNEIFAKRFKELRKKNHLSILDLEDKIGVSMSTINHWESNLRSPSIKKIFKLAEYFNVSVDYLLGRTDNPNINH